MFPRRRALLPPPAARSGFHAGSADVPRTRSRRGGEEEEQARGAAGRDPAAYEGRGETCWAGRGLPALRRRASRRPVLTLPGGETGWIGRAKLDLARSLS